MSKDPNKYKLPKKRISIREMALLDLSVKEKNSGLLQKKGLDYQYDFKKVLNIFKE